MTIISLLFSTRANPFSALIRATTWSRWSHVALIDGDTVIESVALKGVRRVPLAEALSHAKASARVDLPCRNPAALIAAATSQIGKPYDYAAIVGLGLHRDWQEDDSWFCSELIAWAAEQAHSPLFRSESVRRITPEHLWMLAPANRAPDLVFFPELAGK